MQWGAPIATSSGRRRRGLDGNGCIWRRWTSVSSTDGPAQQISIDGPGAPAWRWRQAAARPGRAGAADRPARGQCPHDHVPRAAAGVAASRRDRRGHPRPPGRDRGRRDGLGEDDPAAQDLHGAGSGRAGDDRPHPAPAAGGPHGGRPHRRGAGRRAWWGHRVRRALHRPGRRRHAREADDRRHPAGRAAARSPAVGLRHHHRGRGPRAQPQHRLHPRLPGPAAAPAAGPQGHHHLGHHRDRSVLGPLRRRAGDRGDRSHLSRSSCATARSIPPRPALAPAPAGEVGDPTTPSPATRSPGSPTRCASCGARSRATCSCSWPASATSATRPTRCGRSTCPTPRSCRCTRGFRWPSSTACSRRTRAAASCWRPTWPRRR